MAAGPNGQEQIKSSQWGWLSRRGGPELSSCRIAVGSHVAAPEAEAAGNARQAGAALPSARTIWVQGPVISGERG